MENNFTPTIIKYVNGDVKIYENLTKIDNNTIENKYMISGVKIGNSVKFINHGAFFGCSNAKYITFPDSVVKIENRSFEFCKKIKSIELPIHTKIIGVRAFSRCENLNTIILPDDLETISAGLFSYCKQIKHLTIPKSVKYIEGYAFFGCESLNKIICLSETSPTFEGFMIFYNMPENGTLYYPKGSDYAVWKDRLPDGWKLIEI